MKKCLHIYIPYEIVEVKDDYEIIRKSVVKLICQKCTEVINV